EHDKITVFVGPSAYGIEAELQRIESFGVSIYPPVKRGDLYEVAKRSATIVIVDGLFHTVPAVGHIEIREALESGIRVIGCSSMVAIRAYEMRTLGMIGFGRVFEMFKEFEDFTDDELTQLHGPEPDFLPFSEALVNIRIFLDSLIAEGILSRSDGADMVKRLAP